MKDATQSPGGYVRLYRSLLSWEWFHDSPTLHVFIYLLLTACFRPLRHEGIDLAPGQLITSYSAICSRTGLSPQQVRTALKRLKSTGEITQQTTSRFSLITLNNYDRWQTTLQQAPPHPANTPPTCSQQQNKKENHITQEKKKGVPPHGSQDERRGLSRVGVCI